MQRIVVAAKSGAEEPWLADAAADLARQTGASVAAVSVDGVDLEALSALPRSEYAALAERSARAIADRLRADGIEATAAVRAGRVVPGILEFAEEQDADVIIAGASHRGRVTARLLGDVPLELVQRSKRPVLVISRPSRT
jgi:nucleotide-binding universal stress UspA family protein